MSDNIHVIHERLGALTAKVDAAHFRTDKLEVLMKEDLSQIKDDIRILLAAENRRKGWLAAVFVFAGVFQFIITMIARLI
jgi:hypothetical protein